LVSRCVRGAFALCVVHAPIKRKHAKPVKGVLREMLHPFKSLALKIPAIRRVVRERDELRAQLDAIGKGFERKNGVLFIGYAEGALGLGEAFRANLTAAATTPIPFSIYPLRTGIESRLIAPYMPERYDYLHCFRINIIEVAVDQLPVV